MKKLLFLTLTGVALSACSPEPQPVELGTDLCAHCKMTIVQEPFAAELVTKKGKVFKFDAIECMAAYLGDQEDTEFELFLVKDFNQPATWQDARTSSYLISESLPSPMGAFLSAYKTPEAAAEMQNEKGGTVMEWESLRKQLER